MATIRRQRAGKDRQVSKALTDKEHGVGSLIQLKISDGCVTATVKAFSPPSRSIGLTRRIRCSSSSRSSSSSYAGLLPGTRPGYPIILTTGLGSHRPPPVALQMALAWRSGYVSSSPKSDSVTCAPEMTFGREEVRWGKSVEWRIRGEVWARRMCGCEDIGDGRAS